MGYLGFVIALIALLGALFLAAKWGGKSGMAIYSAGTLLLTFSYFAMIGEYEIVFADGLSMVGLLIGAFLLSMIIYFLKYGTKAGIKFGFKIGGMALVYGLLVFSIVVANNFPNHWFDYLYTPIAVLALIVTSTLALWGMLELINKNKLKGVLAFVLLALVAIVCTIFYYLVLGLFYDMLTEAMTTCGISALIALVEMILGYFIYLLATWKKKEVLPAKPYEAPKAEVAKKVEVVAPAKQPVAKKVTPAKKAEPAKKTVVAKAPAKKSEPAKKAVVAKKPVAKKAVPAKKVAPAKKTATKAPAKKTKK